MDKNYGQKLWTKIMDKNYGQKLWTKIMDKNYGQKLWTKIIFVPFLIADISLNLGDGCNCCECCEECWGEKVLEGEEEKVLEDEEEKVLEDEEEKVLEDEEWNKAVSSFSGDIIQDNFFEKKYQNFNIFYDSVINKIKKKQFDAIRELYNKKVQYIKDQLKCKTCEFKEKRKCSGCLDEKECAKVSLDYFCEECFKKNSLNTLKLPVCIPSFTLLKNDKYFVLKVSVLAIYVDENNNLFIRGDWRDKATYSKKFFENNNANKLFKRISDDEKFNNIYVYNYQKTNNSELKKEGDINITNKSHLYFVLGEKNENTICYNKDFDFVKSLKQKGYVSVLNQTQDLYTSFAFCFHAVFYIIYSSLLFQIDPNNCSSGCEKICLNGLHYYFNYKKEDSHASIDELLNNKNLADIKEVAKMDWVNNGTIKAFTIYFNGVYKRMYDLPNKNLDEDCLSKIRMASFTYSKKLLESIITGFENSEYATAQ